MTQLRFAALMLALWGLITLGVATWFVRTMP